MQLGVKQDLIGSYQSAIAHEWAIFKLIPSMFATVKYSNGKVLGTRPNEKYQSYLPWGIERELPPEEFVGTERMEETEIDFGRYDTRLKEIRLIPTKLKLLFLVIWHMFLTVFNKPNHFVVHL